MGTHWLDGSIYAKMVEAGAANLHLHMEEVNDLNVFPIPDGDTGENMMLTMRGGLKATQNASEDLSAVSERIADGMLLSARGNSGVILSQFFEGISQGFRTYPKADIHTLEKAVACGVGCAFEAVVTPTPGTILTVMKDACEAAAHADCETAEEYFSIFVAEAERSLARTPSLLPVLKEAGVVDSGGMGLLYIAKGMYAALCGERVEDTLSMGESGSHTIDPSLFGADSVMEFGYCTELLLRLQTLKTDPAHFDTQPMIDFMQSIGDSVVVVKNDSIVKLHVHTMTPYKVLEYCQRFGEFLTVKIENMMLQHNESKQAETVEDAEPVASVMSHACEARRPFGIVAVATGEGIRQSFLNMGADEVIYGGQTRNPETEDFLKAFERLNADTIFVLPNNGNILLGARQAANMYRASDVRVIPTHSIGDGYAVLSMLNMDSGDADMIEAEMKDAMADVKTAEISKSIRDTKMNGIEIHEGDYIGIADKSILSAGEDREAVACATLERLDPDEHALLLIIRGKGVSAEASARISDYINGKYPLLEICEEDGGQDIYDYILVAE